MADQEVRVFKASLCGGPEGIEGNLTLQVLLCASSSNRQRDEIRRPSTRYQPPSSSLEAGAQLLVETAWRSPRQATHKLADAIAHEPGQCTILLLSSPGAGKGFEHTIAGECLVDSKGFRSCPGRSALISSDKSY
jgi:hypothetical protein